MLLDRSVSNALCTQKCLHKRSKNNHRKSVLRGKFGGDLNQI